MKVLVAYATRHGATEGIAERVAETLERNGLQVILKPADTVDDAPEYDAFVIGSAAYMQHWLKDATTLVRRERDLLSTRPVWLFSSGPIGTEKVNARGQDQLEAAIPREFGEFAESIHPRDERVFFGAFDPDAPAIGVMERLGAPFLRMKSVRTAMPAGDFRDWPTIETWADGIAHELTGAAPAT